MEISLVQTARAAALPSAQAKPEAAAAERAAANAPVLPVVAEAKPEPVQAKAPKTEDLKAAAEQVAEFLQDFVTSSQRDLQISVDEDLNRPVVRVFHGDTGELIRQFPSEEVLSLAKALAEGQGFPGLVGETA